jgi:hypothetical protein
LLSYLDGPYHISTTKVHQAKKVQLPFSPPAAHASCAINSASVNPINAHDQSHPTFLAYSTYFNWINPGGSATESRNMTMTNKNAGIKWQKIAPTVHAEPDKEEVGTF